MSYTHFFLLQSPIMTLLWIDEVYPAYTTLLTWSSWKENKISVVEIETKQEYSTFDGVQPNETNGILFLYWKIQPIIVTYMNNKYNQNNSKAFNR